MVHEETPTQMLPAGGGAAGVKPRSRDDSDTDAGVVHRDLKPHNVLIDKEGNSYLADFGISRSMKSGETMTQTDAILGTIDYMCPEQARGETPDHRGDIYSFGLVLYNMVTGTLPFKTENALSSMMQRVHQDVPKVTNISGSVPQWMSGIISRCCARNPDARYQQASQLGPAYGACSIDSISATKRGWRRRASRSESFAYHSRSVRPFW
jgi:serine/threonine protein kinase